MLHRTAAASARPSSASGAEPRSGAERETLLDHASTLYARSSRSVKAEGNAQKLRASEGLATRPRHSDAGTAPTPRLVAVGAQQEHPVGEGCDRVVGELEVEGGPAALGRLTDERLELAPRLDGHPRPPGPLEIGKHTSELQSLTNLVCRLLLEKKKTTVWRLLGRISAHAVSLAIWVPNVSSILEAIRNIPV